MVILVFISFNLLSGVLCCVPVPYLSSRITAVSSGPAFSFAPNRNVFIIRVVLVVDIVRPACHSAVSSIVQRTHLYSYLCSQSTIEKKIRVMLSVHPVCETTAVATAIHLDAQGIFVW